MTEHYPYRGLSSQAKRLLPRAEEMHRKGMAWRKIAQELRVSHTALYHWRRLADSQG